MIQIAPPKEKPALIAVILNAHSLIENDFVWWKLIGYTSTNAESMSSIVNNSNFFSSFCAMKYSYIEVKDSLCTGNVEYTEILLKSYVFFRYGKAPRCLKVACVRRMTSTFCMYGS